MTKKAVVFIDGNNFYHNIKSIERPGNIDIIKLSRFICDHFNFKLDKAADIRYYNSIPDIRDSEITYYKHMEFLSNLEKQGITIITRKLQKQSTKEVQEEKEGLLASLDLCPVCRPIVKQNCYECIGSIKKKEKGIDVKIAVDIIDKNIIKKQCDKCVLISGDADFIPAMQLVKDRKKEVITACPVKGYSRALRDGRFRYFILTRKDMVHSCLKDYKKIKAKRST